MRMQESTSWQSYEDVARYLLENIGDVLGLKLQRVEGKQTLVGESGTTWEIDGKGVLAGTEAIIVVECRRYPTSKLKQSDLAALAWTISDVGASGGIVVTPLGVQKGGQLVAQSADINVVHLDADATRTDYVVTFLKKVLIGRSFALHVTPTVTAAAAVLTDIQDKHDGGLPGEDD